MLNANWNDDPITLAFIVLAVAGLLIWVCRLAAQEISRKQWELVKENSVCYKNILHINEDTPYVSDIGKKGMLEYVRYSTSKAQYDKIFLEDVFREYVEAHKREIEYFLEAVRENRWAYKMYIERYNACKSEITPDECKELGISFNRFREIEDKLVAAQKLEIVQHLAIMCYAQYTSPQGRNHYSKHQTFFEDEIRAELIICEEQARLRTSEVYRRKLERAKATPALRYDIMRRDGFRCCLCGRSAQQGVELEVDHIVPVSRGGNTTPENLQTLCRDCNRGKGAKM